MNLAVCAYLEGDCFTFGKELSGVPLFPHVYTKEATFSISFDGSGGAPPLSGGFKWISEAALAVLEKVQKRSTRQLQDEGIGIAGLCAEFDAVYGRVSLWPDGWRMPFDDAAHLKTSELRFYDGQLIGMMHQSKTTGAGKRVRELPIFIARDAYVLQDDWLSVGFDLVKLQMPRDRVFVFPEGCFYGVKYGTSHVSYAEAVAGSSKTMALLEGYSGRLIPSGWERFWSEHSERATLPSGLAALGVEKSSRDLLGRWCPEGSDVYVRTYNSIVRKMQKKIVAVLRGEAAYEELDEGCVLEELKVWLHEKWTVPEDQAGRAVEAWKDKIGVKGRPQATIPISEEETTIYDGSQSEKEEDNKAQRDPKRRKMNEALDEEREGNYVVVYRRAGRGTLHRLGEKRCWMAKKRVFLRLYPKIFTEDSIQKLNYNANLCGLLLPGAPLADALYADIGESSASAAKWDPMTRAAPNPKADISRAAKEKDIGAEKYTPKSS
eukprot:g22581.t1